MTTPPHPYVAARAVLQELHKIFLQQGHRGWSVSPTKDGKANFEHVGLDAEGAGKAFRLLVEKGLAEYRGTRAFVITDYGVSACDHPGSLDHVLPVPKVEARVSSAEGATPSGDAERTGLEQYVPRVLRSRFVAVDHIGGGSFGNVYQIVDRETQQRFALKVTISAPDAKARAVREVEAMRALNHENVMRALETDPQGDWFIFPLAEGTLGNLHAWGRLGPSAAFEVAVQVGGALAHAHAAGFLHRDLHVDNVLRFDGSWVVADWGLSVARGNERLTRTRSIGGIQTWTAPEQLLGLKNADHRSDLFSLGRLVEWLVTGRVPDIDRPGELPAGHPLAAFVDALTQLEPAKRPANAAAALAMLPDAASPIATPPMVITAPAVPARLPASPAVMARLGEGHRARVEQVRERRDQAIALGDGPVVVLHVYPVEETGNFDLLPLKQGRFEPLPPIAHLHWQLRFNHDGLLAYWPDPPPASQRLQLFRNGGIELVDTYCVQRTHSPEPILFPLNLERDIVNFVDHWAGSICRPLGVRHPLVLCLSITGIQGFELHIDHRPPFLPKPLFDRDTVSFRPVVLDGVQDSRRLLKPTFDALWQAAGEDRSLGYSAAGEWLEGAHPRR